MLLPLMDAGGRPVINQSFLNGAMPAGYTFTRASTGTYIGSDGLLKSAAINEPRFECDPITLAPRGVLLEPQRTNLVTTSAQFDAWDGNHTTVPAPVNGVGAFLDGTNTAWGVPSGATSYLQQNYTIAANTDGYTASFFAKSIASGAKVWTGQLGINGAQSMSGAIYDFDTDTVSNGWARKKYANGWVRLYRTFANNGTGTTFLMRLDDDGAGNVWGKTIFCGAQLEQGYDPTSYIPTGASAVTRSMDFMDVPSVPWFNQSQGTMLAECDILSTTTYPIAVCLLGAGGGKYSLGFNPNRTGVYYNAVDTINTANAATFGVTCKEAASYAASERHISLNGGAVGEDAAVPFNQTIVSMHFGYRAQSSAQSLFGHLKGFKYWNRKLSNAELQRITTL